MWLRFITLQAYCRKPFLKKLYLKDLTKYFLIPIFFVKIKEVDQRKHLPNNFSHDQSCCQGDSSPPVKPFWNTYLFLS